MPHLSLIAFFFAGAILANAVPHVVSGLMGQAFQTPFAKPPGQGRSTARTNVVWGFANLVVGYLLLTQVGVFDLHDRLDAAALFAGAFLLSFYLCRRFGRYNGGNTPEG